MKQNPWKGLAAYREPKAADEFTYAFCGREHATKELAGMVKENLFVTLYGQTGIGKTSLLEAGVFPELRKQNYLPVTVRFSMGEDTVTSFAEAIIKNIESHVEEIRTTVSDAEIRYYEIDCLWTYFATRHFYNGGNEVYPVIVLDQFEENFILSREKTEVLLRQLYSLIDDNKIFPEGYHNGTIFRVVISIREDDLFRFEDSIDQLHLTDFKFNRYRLTNLTETEASEVVYVPGEDILPRDHSERNAVVSEIIRLVKNGNEGQINTLTLSLVCSILYDKVSEKGAPVITVGDVQEIGSNPLSDFYLSIAGRIPKHRQFIESRLVDATGRRNSVNEEEMDIAFPKWRTFMSGKNRIFQCTNHKVELVHDMLAKAIYDVREKKEKKKKGRMLKVSVIVTVFLMLVISLFSAVFSFGGRSNGGYTQKLVPLFPPERMTATTPSDVSENLRDHIKYLTVSYSSKISGYAALTHLTIKTTGFQCSIQDCPNLANIRFQCDSASIISISDCPNLRTLILPGKDIKRLIIDHASDDLKIIIWNKGKYQMLDDVLWNLEDSSVVYVKNGKQDTPFPYVLKDSTKKAYGYRDTLYNNGHWIDNILFNEDSTEIISYHNSTDKVLDLSIYPKLESIRHDAFDNGNIRKVIFGDMRWNYARAFQKCSSLDTVELNKQLYGWFPKGVTYMSNNDNYHKKNGIVYRGGKPILLSSEYDKAYYYEETANRNFNFLFPANTISFRDNGISFSNDNAIEIPDSAVFLYGCLESFIQSDKKGNKYLDNHIIHQNSSDIFPVGEELCLSSLSTDTKAVHIIRQTEFRGDIPDTTLARITLYVPYGQLYDYLYESEYAGFGSIMEENMWHALSEALSETYDNIMFAISEVSLVKWFFVFSLAGIFVVFFLLCYLQLRHRDIPVFRKIIYSVGQSVGILLFASLSWTGCYWLLFNGLDFNNAITCSTIAAFFALFVILSIYNNFLYQIRHINWNRFIRKIRIFLARNRKTVFMAAIITAVLTAVILNTDVQSKKAEQLADTIQRLHLNGQDEKALALVSDYMDAPKQINNKAFDKLYSWLIYLSDIAGYRHFPAYTGIGSCKISISADSRYLAYYNGGTDSLKVWRLKDEEVVFKKRVSGIINMVAFCNNNRSVAIVDDADIEVRNLYDNRHYSLALHREIGSYFPSEVEFDKNGSMVAFCNGKDITIFGIDSTGISKKATMSAESDIECLCFSNDCRYLFTASSDRMVTQWDLSDNSVIARRCIDCIPKKIACRKNDKIIYYHQGFTWQINLRNGKNQRILRAEIEDFCLINDGRLFVGYGGHNYFVIMNINRYLFSKSVYTIDCSVEGICLSNENKLYIVGIDGNIRIWNISENRRKSARKLARICKESLSESDRNK